jgi:hypothetical protein
MDGERTAGARQKPPGEAGVGGAITPGDDLDAPARSGTLWLELGKLKSANATLRPWKKPQKMKKTLARL